MQKVSTDPEALRFGVAVHPRNLEQTLQDLFGFIHRTHPRGRIELQFDDQYPNALFLYRIKCPETDKVIGVKGHTHTEGKYQRIICFNSSTALTPNERKERLKARYQELCDALGTETQPEPTPEIEPEPEPESEPQPEPAAESGSVSQISFARNGELAKAKARLRVWGQEIETAKANFDKDFSARAHDLMMLYDDPTWFAILKNLPRGKVRKKKIQDGDQSFRLFTWWLNEIEKIPLSRSTVNRAHNFVRVDDIISVEFEAAGLPVENLSSAMAQEMSKILDHPGIAEEEKTELVFDVWNHVDDLVADDLLEKPTLAAVADAVAERLPRPSHDERWNDLESRAENILTNLIRIDAHRFFDLLKRWEESAKLQIALDEAEAESETDNDE